MTSGNTLEDQGDVRNMSIINTDTGSRCPLPADDEVLIGLCRDAILHDQDSYREFIDYVLDVGIEMAS